MHRFSAPDSYRDATLICANLRETLVDKYGNLDKFQLIEKVVIGSEVEAGFQGNDKLKQVINFNR